MDTSIKLHTRLVFDHCNLQTSPEQVVLLNQKAPTLFSGRASNGKTPAGYQVILTGYANFVFEKERWGDDSTPLLGLLDSLRSTPRSMNALALRASIDTYRVENNA